MAEGPAIDLKIQFKFLLLHSVIMLVAFILPFQRSESMAGTWGIPSLWGFFVVFVLPILSPIVLACIVWQKLHSRKAVNIGVFLVLSIFLSAFLVIWFT